MIRKLTFLLCFFLFYSCTRKDELIGDYYNNYGQKLSIKNNHSYRLYDLNHISGSLVSRDSKSFVAGLSDQRLTCYLILHKSVRSSFLGGLPRRFRLEWLLCCSLGRTSSSSTWKLLRLRVIAWELSSSILARATLWEHLSILWIGSSSVYLNLSFVLD